jgi:hypothetical protein
MTSLASRGRKFSPDEDWIDWVELARKCWSHLRKLALRVAKILRIGYPPDLVRAT